MKGIKELNKTLVKELRYKVVDFKTFKKLHYNEGVQDSLDGAVAHISKVEKHNYGYEFTFDNGDVFKVFFTGHFQKNNGNIVRNLDSSNGRVRINQFNGFNTSMFPEKVIGISESIINNEMPHTFEGLVVNVMDGSGHDLTAYQLKIPYDIHHYNLEWTTKGRNARHGVAIKKLEKITGHCYRFSANDDAIYQALDIKKRNTAWIKHYMLINYTKVR